jgi:hypothetical protein
MTSVDTVYSSGPDLVLLQAEVIAVPNTPVSDLKVSLASTSSLYVGQANSYTITVENNGTNVDDGPITVATTFPTGLTPSSGVGTGWSCLVSGQVMTCTYTGSLAANASLPDITAYFTPTATGTLVTSSVVSTGSSSFDNVTSNNTDTLSMTASYAGYVLTDSACTSGVAFASQSCKPITFGNRTAGTDITFFITNVNGSGVPTSLHNTQVRTRSMGFVLVCYNPTTTAGTVPTITASNGAYPSPTLSTCFSSSDSLFATFITVSFDGPSPSSATSYKLRYDDVGVVELYFEDSNGAFGGSGQFTFKPSSIVITSLVSGAVANPAPTSSTVENPAPTSAAGPAWVYAGQPFSMTVAARSSNNITTKNYGREISPHTFNVDVTSTYPDVTNKEVTGSFNPIADKTGLATGTAFAFSDVGVFQFTAEVNGENYLGTGNVQGSPVNVGRVVPYRFQTEVTGQLGCLTNMGCGTLTTAAFSKQVFGVKVTAQNSSGATTRNYKGAFAQEGTLAAYSAAGGGTLNPNGALTAPAPTVMKANFAAGVANLLSSNASAPSYALSTMFSAAAPRASFTAPTSIYLRYSDADSVTSSGSSSLEGGVRVVNGRLLLVGANTSEFVLTPVKLWGQYWTGTRWENATADSASIIPLTGTVFPACDLSATCAALSVNNSAVAPTLASGAAVFRINPPGSGNTGGVTVQLPDSPAHLPTTQARIHFGTFKTPIDLLREVY